MNHPTAPSVLFVCVRNSGKSQMAAGLMRQVAGDEVTVYSAGTRPGTALNALSVQTLIDVGIDISGEHPKAIDPDLLRNVDLVITLGREAHIEPVDGVAAESWDTDEPSERGVEGTQRMQLIRDDITARVTALAKRLVDTPTTESQQRPQPAHRSSSG